MNSKIILVVIGVVVAGGLWFMFQGDAGQSTPEGVAGPGGAPETEKSDATFAGVGSFTALMGLGKNIQCEFAFNDESGEGSGTSYFDGERMRVDSTQTLDGNTIETHMINDGEYVYTWTTGGSDTFAMKTPVAEMEDNSYEYTDIPTETEQIMIEQGQEVEYNCDRWRVDESTFVPPSEIEFMDMQKMFEDMMGNMPEGFELPEGVELPEGAPMMQ